MHPVQTGGNSIAGIEVVAHTTAHVESKGEGLSLGVRHPEWSLGVNVPEAGAPIEVGGSPPVTRDKIAPHAHHVSEIPGLRAPGNRDHPSAELEIPIAAQNQGTFYAADLPAQRTNDGHQRVFKMISLILS